MFKTSILLVLLVVLVAGCGGGSSFTPPAEKFVQAPWMHLSLAGQVPGSDPAIGPDGIPVYTLGLYESRQVGLSFVVSEVPAGSDNPSWTIAPQGVVEINSGDGWMQGIMVLYGTRPGSAVIKVAWRGGARAIRVNVSSTPVQGMMSLRGDGGLTINVLGFADSADSTKLPTRQLKVGDVLHLDALWLTPTGSLPFEPIPLFDWLSGDESVVKLSTRYGNQAELTVVGPGTAPVSVTFQGLAVTFIVQVSLD